MNRLTATLAAFLLLCSPCWAATHALTYQGTTGQTLYMYPASQSLASWATYRVLLTEAIAPNLGKYSFTLDDANGNHWKMFSGATQPASWDAYVASVDLTAATRASQASVDDVPTAAENVTTLLATVTSDTGATTIGRALHYLRTAWASAGVFSEAALAEAPSGGGGVILTDVDQDAVPQGRVFVLTQSDDQGLVAETPKSVAIGSNPTYAVDFKNDLPANGGIATVSAPTIVTGTAGGVTFSVTGRNYSQAKFRCTGVTAGTYKCRVEVTYKTGEVAEGTFTFRVAA